MPGKKSTQPDKALFKRQVELLGFCLSGKGYKSADLQMMLGYEQATIGRDTARLRSYGIDIHSVQGAMEVKSAIDPALLGEFIIQYVGYCYSPNSYDRATTLLVKRLKEAALHYFVVLEHAIETGTMVEIDYEKRRGMIERGRSVGPLMLFQANDEWRVLAIHEGTTKQFLLSKIRRIAQTGKTFNKIPKAKLREMFQSMWRGWLGSPQYQVKLHLNKAWTDRLNHKMFTENQKLTINPDGSSTLEAGVANLVEVGGWVAAQGSGVVVLEPFELRDEVIKLARQTLQNYN